jgi:hypothetical protein
MAETTGGRAFVNDNDVERHIPAVLSESSSYYLLGVDRPASREEGQLHRVEVRVNRRGVNVRTRQGYYDPTQRERQALEDMTDAGDPTVAIVGAMPRSDVPLNLAVAPVAVTGDQASLALVLGVSPSGGDGKTLLPGDQVEIIAGLFDPETGQSRGTSRRQVSITGNLADGSKAYYEVFARMNVPSGRYELRVGLRADDGRTASVYTSVEIPDIDDDLWVSGLVIAVEPRPDGGPPDAFGDLLPATPTARRAFRRTDRVHAFVRVYQNRSPFVQTTVATRVTDANDSVVFQGVEEVSGTHTAPERSADARTEIPIAGLAPGEYLLTTDVEGRGTTVRRTARFRIIGE